LKENKWSLHSNSVSFCAFRTFWKIHSHRDNKTCKSYF
jgi:hypothetical protein